MIHAGMSQNIHQRSGGAGFLIARAEYQTTDTAMNNRSGTHNAGLQRDIEGGVQQAVIFQNFAAFTQRHHLRVRGWIVLSYRPVPAFADRFIALHQYRPDRNFALLARPPRQL